MYSKIYIAECVLSSTARLLMSLLEPDPFDINYSANRRAHQLYQLLRECVLSHRWEPATQVLLALSGESSSEVASTVHRVRKHIFMQV